MADKYTVEQKIDIVIESLSATNIAELCRRHGISVAQLNRRKEKFIDGGSRALGESSKGNTYQKEIDIVAYSTTREELLFAECKWTGSPVSMGVVDALIRKSETLKEQFPGKKYRYAVFSKSGFREVKSELNKDVILMDLADIEHELYRK